MATFIVTTEIELPEDFGSWQVEKLEGEVKKACLEAGRIFYGERLLEYEKWFIGKHKEWDRKERWPKKIATMLGEVRLERYRVWDRNEKRSRYPLDEVLGIKKWVRESKDYSKALAEEAVQHSYRKSAHEMEDKSFVKRGLMSQWRTVQRVSQEIQEAKMEKVLEWKHILLPDPPKVGEIDPCPVLGIDLDDTYCRSWKKKRYLKDHGVRVAVLYRCKERVGKHRWMLKDKTVVCSGPKEPYHDFLNRVTQTAIVNYGLHIKTKVVVHGDGDPGIRNYALYYFVNALYRLDPWHVKKKIREAFGFTKVPNDWYEDIYGKPDSLIAKIKLLDREIAEDDSSKEKITALIQYLENNKEGLLPSGVSKTEKQKYPRLFLRGSGTIERNIAWTVNDRFKLPRMSWSLNGLENLLFLRQNYLNKDRQLKFKPIPGNKLDLLCLN